MYIDGFNLYYGALKGSPNKWLDLRRLCDRLLPGNDVACIRYFTAKVEGRGSDPRQPQRQETYLRALRTIPDLTIHLGQFRSRPTRLPLTDPPTDGPRTVSVIRTEEKGSDVNLASLLLRDGFEGRFQTAVVVTNDSDLKLPIEIVRDRPGLGVGVVNPHKPSKRSRDLSPTFFRQLRPQILGDCQFPYQLQDARGTFRKPDAW